MARSGPSLDTLPKVRTDGQIVSDGILPAVVVRLEVREPLPA